MQEMREGGEDPRRRTWQPSPVFLPGESHGQRSLADYSHGVANSQTWLKWLRTLLNLVLEWAFIALKQRAPKHSGLKQQFIFSWLYGLGRMLWSLPQGAAVSLIISWELSWGYKHALVPLHWPLHVVQIFHSSAAGFLKEINEETAGCLRPSLGSCTVSPEVSHRGTPESKGIAVDSASQWRSRKEFMIFKPSSLVNSERQSFLFQCLLMKMFLKYISSASRL